MFNMKEGDRKTTSTGGQSAFFCDESSSCVFNIPRSPLALKHAFLEGKTNVQEVDMSLSHFPSLTLLSSLRNSFFFSKKVVWGTFFS